jgi:polysaccharide pyruvyl transferase WcaK-like protein
MIDSVTLIGSSSGRNAGDAAILAGMMDSLDAHAERRLLFEIPSYRPKYVWSSYSNKVRPVSMLPWAGSAGMFGIPTLLSIMRSDATLIFDNMLFDRALYNPLFNFMSTMRLFLPLAKKRGKLLGCYNIGAGPVHTERGKKILAEIMALMDLITVRDQDSYDLLRNIGVKSPILIGADAALSVAPVNKARVNEIMASLGYSQDSEILALNVNTYINSWSESGDKTLTRQAFCKSYAKAIDRVAENIGAPILFVCTQYHDISITNEIIKNLTTTAPVLLISNKEFSYQELKGIFSRCALLFAMRLHASILCSSVGTPVAGLAFQKKVTSYYTELELPENALSFDKFSEEALFSHIIRSWKTRKETRQHLAKRIPELVARADYPAKIFSEIFNGKRSVKEIE